MKQFLFLLMFLSPRAYAFQASIPVLISSGSLQPGTTAGFNVSSGTVQNLYSTTATFQNISGTFIGLGRNRVINGDFFWDQRNEGAAVTLGSNVATYGADRFFGYNRGYPGKFTMQQVTPSPPPQFAYDWKMTITSSTLFVASSETANAEYVVTHRIEGPNWVDSAFTTNYAQTFTVSFWVRTSSAGWYGFSAESQSNNPDTYPTHYYIPTVNVWTKVALTIPGDTGGPWSFLKGAIGMKLIWDLGSGSGFQKTSSAWYGGASQEYNRLTNDNRIMTVSNATWELAGVQCELGSQSTAYEFLPLDISKKRCQRYFEKTYLEGTVPGAASSASIFQVVAAQISAVPNMLSTFVNFMAEKAIVPTVTLYATDGTQGQMTWFSAAGVGTKRNTTVNDTSLRGFDVNQNAATDALGYGNYTADGEL